MKLGISFTFLLFCLFHFSVQVQSSKILFMYPISSKSETHLFLPLAKALTAKGHELTLVSSVKSDKLPPNILEIVPTTPITDSDFCLSDDLLAERRRMTDKLAFVSSFDMNMMLSRCHQTYQNEDFKKLLDKKFDLIIMSTFGFECFEGLVYKFQAPYIIMASLPVPNWVAVKTGFHPPPSFIPLSFFDFPSKMTFGQRFVNTIMTWMVDAMMTTAENEEIYRKYLGQDYPSSQEIQKNLSLILTNAHFSLTFPRPALPDTIEVGGIHCRAPLPLPKDLEDFIASAEHGVIFFSLGSVVTTKTFPDHIRKMFLNVFAKLKQKVLWKWDKEVMEGLPPNVKLSKWLPQQDILGHPNVKLFISHSGLLSTQESSYHGVPMLGIPIFVDQDINALNAQDLGFALKEEILEITEESLSHKINRLLNEPKFTETAKRMSNIFKDRMQTPLEKATFWVEYVLRHKGAPQLKSPARELNYFQYHSLDVLGVIVGILFTLITLTVLFFRWLCCSSKKTGIVSPNKNKKRN